MRERLGIASEFARTVALAAILTSGNTGSARAQEVGTSLEPSPISSPASSLPADYPPFNPDEYDWRAAIMGPKSIYVCYSDIEPFHVSDPREDPADIIVVENADCEEILPTIEVVLYEGFTADIELGGNAEIVDLLEYRNAGEPYPPIFETIIDNTVYYE